MSNDLQGFSLFVERIDLHLQSEKVSLCSPFRQLQASHALPVAAQLYQVAQHPPLFRNVLTPKRYQAD